MIGLEERLANLRPEIGGDWADVVSRARGLDAALSRRRRRRLILVLAALVLVIGAGTALAIGHRVFGWFEVSRSHRDVPPLAAADVPYVFGRVLHQPGQPPAAVVASAAGVPAGADVGARRELAGREIRRLSLLATPSPAPCRPRSAHRT